MWNKIFGWRDEDPMNSSLTDEELEHVDIDALCVEYMSGLRSSCELNIPLASEVPNLDEDNQALEDRFNRATEV